MKKKKKRGLDLCAQSVPSLQSFAAGAQLLFLTYAPPEHLIRFIHLHQRA
jgi:hypothetical protein